MKINNNSNNNDNNNNWSRHLCKGVRLAVRAKTAIRWDRLQGFYYCYNNILLLLPLYDKW